jgi:SDR family mycofactocin-dependent oxidoreductase
MDGRRLMIGSGPLAGRVALVTGAARGLGRAHCMALAEAGADLVAADLPGEDLGETVAAVERLGRRIVARGADVRDQLSLDRVVAEAVSTLGGMHVVVANAGISNWSRFWEMSDDQWKTMLDVNLTGVWRTFKATVPYLIDRGQGGSLIAISSVAGLKALPGQSHYSAAKHGVVGLVRAAAVELGPYEIRVNSVHPWGVKTRLAEDPAVTEILQDNPTYAASFGSILPAPAIAEPEDIAAAVVWLASDASRCVTGIQLPVDMCATTV